jgi:ABC-type glycerol-3-phosphate transport system substrate-binding protein
MRGHRKIQQLLAVYDDLTVEEKRRVESHLQGCQECAATLAAYRAMDDAVHGAMEEKVRQMALRGIAQRTLLSPAASRSWKEHRSGWLSSLGFGRARPQVFAARLMGATVLVLVVMVASVILGGIAPFEQYVSASTPTLTGDHRTPFGAQPLPTPTFAAPGVASIVSATETITYFIGSLGVETGPLRELAKEFQATRPGMNVWVESYFFHTKTGFTIEDIARDADCFSWPAETWKPELRNVVRPLEPFLEQDPLDLTDFYEGLVDEFLWQETLWALPAEAKPTVIEFNKRLFDEAGLEYPTPDWTLEDFVRVARQLTKGDEATRQYGFVGDLYELNDVKLFLNQMAGQLYDTTADLPAFAMTDPDTIAAIQWYVDLARIDGVRPLLFSGPNDGKRYRQLALLREQLIRQGRAAMWTTIGGLNPTAEIERMRLLDIGRVVLPSGKEGHVTGGPRLVSGYYISEQSANPDLCWQWIRFLSEQPDAVQSVPARRSVAEGESDRWRFDQARYDVYQKSIANGTASPDEIILNQHPWLQLGDYWLLQAYGRIVRDRVPMESALRDAQEFAGDYRTCVLASAAVLDMQLWEECARQADPGYQDSH